MIVEVAFKQLLEANAALALRVGSRIYPVRLPDEVDLPALSFFRAATETSHTHDGPSGLTGPLFQVSVWAKSYLEAAEIADLVRLALDGFKGSQANVEISGIFLRTQHDTFEDATRIYQRPMDFEVWHAEAH